MTFQVTKDPDAKLPYGLDWKSKGWLVGSDTIVDSEWLVSGPDESLVMVEDSNSTEATKVVLMGGTLGVTYTVTNRITTAEGWIDDRSIAVTVSDK